MSILKIMRGLSKVGGSPSMSLTTIPLVVFSGESNSGGFAQNADLSSDKLLPRPALQILNNTSLLFEDLEIGQNNLIGHTGLEMYAGTHHGWEAGLADIAESGELGAGPIYLVKTGQGGSVIEQWNEYTNYSYFQARVNAAISILSITENPKFVIFWSLGINDAIAHTSIDDFKSGTISHFNKIRTHYGPVPIVMTKFMSTYPTFSSAVVDICNTLERCYYIETDDLPLESDGNHWSAEGEKIIAIRMVQKLSEKKFQITSPTLL